MLSVLESVDVNLLAGAQRQVPADLGHTRHWALVLLLENDLELERHGTGFCIPDDRSDIKDEDLRRGGASMRRSGAGRAEVAYAAMGNNIFAPKRARSNAEVRFLARRRQLRIEMKHLEGEDPFVLLQLDSTKSASVAARAHSGATKSPHLSSVAQPFSGERSSIEKRCSSGSSSCLRDDDSGSVPSIIIIASASSASSAAAASAAAFSTSGSNGLTNCVLIDVAYEPCRCG